MGSSVLRFVEHDRQLRPRPVHGGAGWSVCLCCPELADRAGWKNDTIIADNFGGMQNVNWGSCQATGAQCIVRY